MFDSNWECFGGNLAEKENCFEIVNQEILLDLEPCSAKYFILDRLLMHRVVLKTYGVFENKLYIRSMALERQDGVATEPDEEQRYSLVDFVTILIKKIPDLPLRMERKFKFRIRYSVDFLWEYRTCRKY